MTRETVTLYVPDGYADANEFLRDCQFERVNHIPTPAQPTQDILREALESIRIYSSDTLSGRADGPDDREWQREAVVEINRRARAALSAQPPAAPVETDGEKAARDYEHGYNDGVEWAQTHGRCSAASEHAKVADWLDDQARIATNSLHCGDNSAMIQQTHDWANRLEAAARHLRAVPQTSGVWQPIATAPRALDKPIIAWNSRQPTWPPVVVRWDERDSIEGEPHWSDAATPAGDALYYNQNFFDFWQPAPDTSALSRPQRGSE